MHTLYQVVELTVFVLLCRDRVVKRRSAAAVERLKRPFFLILLRSFDRLDDRDVLESSVVSFAY